MADVVASSLVFSTVGVLATVPKVLLCPVPGVFGVLLPVDPVLKLANAPVPNPNPLPAPDDFAVVGDGRAVLGEEILKGFRLECEVVAESGPSRLKGLLALEDWSLPLEVEVEVAEGVLRESLLVLFEFELVPDFRTHKKG